MLLSYIWLSRDSTDSTRFTYLSRLLITILAFPFSQSSPTACYSNKRACSLSNSSRPHSHFKYYPHHFYSCSQKLVQKVNLVLHDQAHLQHLQPPRQIIALSHIAPPLHQRSRKHNSHDFSSQRLAFR